MTTVQTPARRAPLAALVMSNYVAWFGNAITLVAVPLYVLERTGSPLWTGLAGFANALPMAVAGLVGGVFVDRFGARRISIAADALAGLVLLGVPLLDAAGALPLPVLMALLLVRTLVDTPGSAARQALLPAAIAAARTRPEAANSWFQSGPRLALIIGPPLGALLVERLGGTAALYVNTATFLLSAALVAALVTRPEPQGSARPATRFRADFVEGWTFLTSHPLLLAILGVVVITNFIDDAFTPVLLPLYAERVLGDPQLLGWLIAATGVGAVLGTFLYAPASRTLLKDRYVTFVGCFAVVAAARIAMTFLPNLWIMIVLMFVVGLASGPLNPLITTVIQERTPEQVLGRVFGAVMALAFVAAPVGILFAGWLAELAGIRWVLIVFAVAYVALIVAALRSATLRTVRDHA
ncbi:MFS transporter [Micromonospora sp. CA-246542]|uniref:MFS transporter n=1 Tax=Micromonospora sp. CA-246542 TaxID=3239959 RepID=UPI003D93A75D